MAGNIVIEIKAEVLRQRILTAVIGSEPLWPEPEGRTTPDPTTLSAPFAFAAPATLLPNVPPGTLAFIGSRSEIVLGDGADLAIEIDVEGGSLTAPNGVVLLAGLAGSIRIRGSVGVTGPTPHLRLLLEPAERPAWTDASRAKLEEFAKDNHTTLEAIDERVTQSIDEAVKGLPSSSEVELAMPVDVSSGSAAWTAGHRSLAIELLTTSGDTPDVVANDRRYRRRGTNFAMTLSQKVFEQVLCGRVVRGAVADILIKNMEDRRVAEIVLRDQLTGGSTFARSEARANAVAYYRTQPGLDEIEASKPPPCGSGTVRIKEEDAEVEILELHFEIDGERRLVAHLSLAVHTPWYAPNLHLGLSLPFDLKVTAHGLSATISDESWIEIERDYETQVRLQLGMRLGIISLLLESPPSIRDMIGSRLDLASLGVLPPAAQGMHILDFRFAEDSTVVIEGAFDDPFDVDGGFAPTIWLAALAPEVLATRTVTGTFEDPTLVRYRPNPLDGATFGFTEVFRDLLTPIVAYGRDVALPIEIVSLTARPVPDPGAIARRPGGVLAEAGPFLVPETRRWFDAPPPRGHAEVGIARCQVSPVDGRRWTMTTYGEDGQFDVKVEAIVRDGSGADHTARLILRVFGESVETDPDHAAAAANRRTERLLDKANLDAGLAGPPPVEPPGWEAPVWEVPGWALPASRFTGPPGG